MLPLFVISVSAQPRVRLNASSAILGVGEVFNVWQTQQSGLTAELALKRTWRSSNTNVATVNDTGSRITAVGEGTATVTLFIDGVAGPSIRVTVRPAPTAVKIEDVTIAEGDVERVKILYPKGMSRTKDGFFRSADWEVARVNDGVLIGVGEGKTTITLTLYNDVKTTFDVTVTAPSTEKKPPIPEFVIGTWVQTSSSAVLNGGSMTFNADGTGVGVRSVTMDTYDINYIVSGNNLIIINEHPTLGKDWKVWTFTPDRTQFLSGQGQGLPNAYTKAK